GSRRSHHRRPGHLDRPLGPRDQGDRLVHDHGRDRDDRRRGPHGRAVAPGQPESL
ncbi:MAG: hypothetical protein AVDCRST_MAG53-2190, partial [uncultured Solirubrobacteraceae bacterium]